ncbi:MAG: hypothetical protein ACXVJD_07905, partial [Mucilaginibacter sp.]
MKEKEIQNELSSIRNMMERSSKFISLSGLSGILAGVYALIGAALAWYVLKDNPMSRYSFLESLSSAINIIVSLIIIAAGVLLASLVTALVLSKRKAKKNGQSIWGKT